MENFTPYSALAGGALIGLAASALLLMNGRIAGISGILGGLLAPARGDIAWRLLFLAGLAGGALIYRIVGADGLVVRFDAAYPVIVAGGLLVGFGTIIGGGCTSGHGVCGIARLSPRSLVATLTFLVTGVATVVLVRHLVGV
ncbi:MAG: YeeE/YedE family protein [Alphaproteobacteria bacterium]